MMLAFFKAGLIVVVRRCHVLAVWSLPQALMIVLMASVRVVVRAFFICLLRQLIVDLMVGSLVVMNCRWSACFCLIRCRMSGGIVMEDGPIFEVGMLVSSCVMA